MILFFFPLVFAQNFNQQKLSDDELITLTQKAAFDFFWNEANPNNGLIKDRNTQWSQCSIASVGFGLTAICIGVDHNWVSREDARKRILNTLRTFWNYPQGSSSSSVIGYKGFFYHFINMNTCTRDGNCELSSIDTGLLLAGILYAKQFFTNDDPDEIQIRSLADSIYYRINWTWMCNNSVSLTMGWTPESGFIQARWVGYNEAMILYILALGAPNSTMGISSWNRWTQGYEFKTYYGFTYVIFPPLFGHQYSHCWIDFRNIIDQVMGFVGFTYFENSRRATLAQREYCIANPGKFQGYGSNLWGLTAGDGPNGYIARGAPPAQNDDGTISPTASISSMPFTPNESMQVMRYMYDNYKNYIWTNYGFCDAFNLKFNWWDKDVIGIDQGPIIIMLENYKTQRVWNLFMQNPDIQRGLQKAGFNKITAVAEVKNIPKSFSLTNYPNPFNPETTIKYSIPKKLYVTIKIYNSLGQMIKTLIEGNIGPGDYSISFIATNLPCGIYFVKMVTDKTELTNKVIFLK
jgi:hypothetical protein